MSSIANCTRFENGLVFGGKVNVVAEGQLIGYSGNTGKSEGPHLHYECNEGSEESPLFVNPLSILPYANKNSPVVKIINPLNKSTLVVWGSEKSSSETEIKIKVTTKDKDLSKLELKIDNNNAKGANFDFEKGEHYKVKVKTGSIPDDPSYVVPVNMTKDTGSDDTFIYKWNKKAFLSSKGVNFIKEVPISATAVTAKGTGEPKVINVAVGTPTGIPQNVYIASAKQTQQSLPPCTKTSNPEITAKLKVKEEGGKLTNELIKSASNLVVCSERQILSPSITLEGDGSTAKLTATATGLKDGQHEAIIETLDFSGKVRDSKNMLFLVDTKPPVLTLVEPLKKDWNKLLPTQRTFVIEIQEDGSGLRVSGKKNVVARVKVNGQEAKFFLNQEGDKNLLVVSANKENLTWWDGMRWTSEKVNLSVEVEDRAGNIGKLNQVFTVLNFGNDRKRKLFPFGIYARLPLKFAQDTNEL